MDVADRSHCSSLETSSWLVDKVVVEPPLLVGIVAIDGPAKLIQNINACMLFII